MKARRNHSGRIEVRRGREVIAAAAFTYGRVWEAACKADGISPDAKIVEFSKGNRFVQFLEPALHTLRQARTGYDAGGYVGLSMS